MSDRIPKQMWQRPRYEVLLGGKYQEDEPPFDPFPSVHNVINATFCSVASLHDLLYGYNKDSAVKGPYGSGDLFHDFIADFKTKIGRGVELPELNEIPFLFEDFARDYDEQTKRVTQIYVENWLQARKRFDELKNIKKNANTFFEVSVANSYVPFVLDNGTRSYPLYGVIDEIDFDRKRIIERTIKGDKADKEPPLLKDFQVWLYWKILTSLKKEHYPKIWRDHDFNVFGLVVETPYEDFHVEKNNIKFENMVHSAFAWISDIAKEWRAVGEAWGARTCTFNDRSKECSLAGLSCYRRRYTYPTSLGQLRRGMEIFFRPLLWEQMWDHHLLWYQLMMLPENQLKNELKKYVQTGKIVKEEDRKIELELDGSVVPVSERTVGGDRRCEMIFGTFHLGIKVDAVIENIEGKRLSLKLDKHMLLPQKQVKIFFPETAMLKEAPWWLKDQVKREIFKLEKWSLDNKKKAEGHSVIQMLECIFGAKALRMEGKSEKH